MTQPLRVLMVASELHPLAKSGGLADMVSSLALALHARGVDVRILLPRYGWIERDSLNRHRRPLEVPLGTGTCGCAVLETRLMRSVPLYVVEHDAFFNRPQLYGEYGDYPDNPARFSLLCRAAGEICHQLNWIPDVIHAHDWQGALVAPLCNPRLTEINFQRRYGWPKTATLLTVHNLAYQGQFAPDQVRHLGLSVERAVANKVVEWDTFNLLRAGLHHATLINTVSANYAREICTPEYGEALDGLLRYRQGDLFGVVNGIDEAAWDPASDSLLPANYDASDLAGKAACKRALQAEAGLPIVADAPLLAVVSRLTAQKGVDLILAKVAPLLKQHGAQLVVVGTGDDSLELQFKQLAEHHPQHVHSWIRFDEGLAHRVEAGADIFLMPSRWEPCGLNQMYSQRYGTLPLVRGTGGLRDTVTDFAEPDGTGFMFYEDSPEAFANALERALSAYRNTPDAFRAAIRRAMQVDFSWRTPAATYEYYYRQALARVTAWN